MRPIEKRDVMMRTKKGRMTVAQLMGVVAIAGLAAWAFRSGTDYSFKVVYTATVFGLIVAAVAARYRGPFWYGFAIAGWAYFLIGFNPPTVLPGVGFGTTLYPQHRQINPALLSSLYLQEMCIVLVAEPKALPVDPAATMQRKNELTIRYSQDKSAWDLKIGNIVGIGHSLLTVLIGTIGGWTARLLCAPSPASKDSRLAEQLPSAE
jgi:hypothetical protein